MADSLKTTLVTAPGKIGDLVLDLLIQEDEELSNLVTQFPVEDGSPAADHVVNQATTLTLTGFVTNSPIKSHGGVQDEQARATVQDPDRVTGTDINFAELALVYLRKLRLEKTLVQVTTRRGTFDDMLIQKITRTKNKDTGDALVFTINMIQFRKVKLFFVANFRSKSGRAQPRKDSGKKAAAAAPEYSSMGYKVQQGVEKVKAYLTRAPK